MNTLTIDTFIAILVMMVGIYAGIRGLTCGLSYRFDGTWLGLAAKWTGVLGFYEMAIGIAMLLEIMKINH